MPVLAKPMGPQSGIPVELTPALVEKFWARTQRMAPDECWPWLGCRSENGYGRVTIRRSRTTQAHRLSVIVDGRTIPPTFVVDHMCRNRICVNPAHLRVVSCGVNTLENSESVTAHQAAKTCCDRGHVYNAVNTHIRFLHSGGTTRICRLCRRVTERKYRAKVRARRRAALSTDTGSGG